MTNINTVKDLSMDNVKDIIEKSIPERSRIIEELVIAGKLCRTVMTRAEEGGDWNKASEILFDTGFAIKVDWWVFLLTGDSLDYDDDEVDDRVDCERFAEALYDTISQVQYDLLSMA